MCFIMDCEICFSHFMWHHFFCYSKMFRACSVTSSGDLRLRHLWLCLISIPLLQQLKFMLELIGRNSDFMVLAGIPHPPRPALILFPTYSHTLTHTHRIKKWKDRIIPTWLWILCFEGGGWRGREEAGTLPVVDRAHSSLSPQCLMLIWWL